MSGIIALLPLNAFKAWRGKALPLDLHNLRLQVACPGPVLGILKKRIDSKNINNQQMHFKIYDLL
jgi:hypothetical protein